MGEKQLYSELTAQAGFSLPAGSGLSVQILRSQLRSLAAPRVTLRATYW